MINILRQMKKFIVELMNQLPHFTTQFIDWYDELKMSIWIHFHFSSLLTRENFCVWSLCFLLIISWFSLDISGAATYWKTLVSLLFCEDGFVCWRWVQSSFIITIDQQNIGIRFLTTLMKHLSISYFEQFLFSFSWDIFTYQVELYLFWSLNLLLSTS